MKESLLDTDTVSFFLKGNLAVARQIEVHFERFGRLNLSVISYYEIMNGLLFRDAKRQMSNFEEFALACQILPVTTEIARRAAGIYAELRQQNQMIGHTDVLIGATALQNGLVVVTNNQNHFRRIPDILLDNWL
ncbi:MAG: type II toxin-antitoxin system VapC family toxin [Saprospiraceae bacterium]